jgi:mRNA interferase MazF
VSARDDFPEDPGEGSRRGEVWWASVREPVGSEPGWRRPVVVISSDEFNRSRIRTVLVAAVTGNLRLSEAPGNVPVEALESGLPRESAVNVSQVATLDKDFHRDRVGSLGTRTMLAVDDGLGTVLEL